MAKKRKPLLKGDRHKLGEYVRALADQLGLRDWTINMMHGDPADEDAGASCKVIYGQRVAEIRFREGWEHMSADDLRWITTHELVHCHLWAMNQRVCDLHDVLGSATYTIWEKAYNHALEHATDGIAREWARHLPLPIKAKEAA